MRNPRRVLSKAQILDRVWNYDFGGQANVVELYISYLRKKIDAGREPMIHTLRGAGYVLQAGALSRSVAPARRGRSRAGRCGPGWSPSLVAVLAVVCLVDRRGDGRRAARLPGRPARRPAHRGLAARLQLRRRRRPAGGPGRPAAPAPAAATRGLLAPGQAAGTFSAQIVERRRAAGAAPSTSPAGRCRCTSTRSHERRPEDPGRRPARTRSTSPGLGDYRVVAVADPDRDRDRRHRPAAGPGVLDRLSQLGADHHRWSPSAA